jgi:1,4-dihydroxy-2-naphthoyl-CoA synthase
LAQADRALRDTAQKYIDRAGMKVDLKKVEQRIRENPVPSAAIVAVSGFIVGGGLATRPGAALLALLGRGAARETMTNVVSGKVRSMFR